MKALKRTLIFTLFLACGAWLVGTNYGLNTLLKGASLFTPVHIEYGSSTGTIWNNDIRVSDVRVRDQEDILLIDNVELNWKDLRVIGYELRNFSSFIPVNRAIALDKDAVIEKLDIELEFEKTRELITITGSGKWFNAEFSALAKITHQNDAFTLDSADVHIAENKLSFLQKDKEVYSWNLELSKPELLFNSGYGSLNAHGRIVLNEEIPSITAKISAQEFGIENHNFQDLNINVDIGEYFNITVTAKQLIIEGQEFSNFALQSFGNNKLDSNSWSTDNLIISYEDYIIHGRAKYDFKNTMAEVAFSDEWYGVNASLNFESKKISVKAHAHTDDLSIVMKWLPDVTRLKGKTSAHVEVSGTLDNPKIEAEAHITEITATLPSLGIKIKPMDLHAKSRKDGRFIITGNGIMRRGPGTFKIKGYIDPLKENMPNKIELIGSNVEFIKNDLAHLIASSNLQFSYDKQNLQLNIDGDIEVESGKVTFVPAKSSTVKSRDVVFINEHTISHKNLIRINPNVFIRIHDGIRFVGLDLDATISGKLDINQRKDSLYATGRITIKEGTYDLPGQRFSIHKGRLLYPPGTLLANPVLDIKMLANHGDQNLQIQVAGTAQKPAISETGLGDNQSRALSQALLSGTGALSKSILHDDLKLTELGLTDSQDGGSIDFFENPANSKNSFRDKDFVIGRPISKRLYIQYRRKMDDMKQRVRLTYSLGKNWEIGVESGNRGTGADLSFTVESD